jgi:hypothetical protein
VVGTPQPVRVSGLGERRVLSPRMPPTRSMRH